MELAFWTSGADDRVAIVDADGRELTRGELRSRANQVSRHLRASGCRPGDAVAMVLDNRPEVFVLALAAAQIGLYLVPINRHLAASEIAYILDDSQARAVVCTPEHVAACRAVPARFCTEAADGFSAFETLYSGPSAPPDERSAGGTMSYTSGTTGRPKGVRRPLPAAPPEAVATAFASFLLMYGMKPGEGVHLVVSPLYHTAVLYFATSALHLGQTLVVMDKWTPEGMLDRVQRYRVTSTHTVPTQFVRLLAVEGRERWDTSSLRQVVHSAAPCPVPVKRRMLDWWGPCIFEYYAATEGGGTQVGPVDWLAHPGTVGRAWPGAEVAVLDDAGVRLPPGEIGTVWIKMQQPFAYHRDEAKTARAHNADGWFTVGDAGWLDPDGWLFLADRKIDLIISGGVNIYPAEVESALLEHPAVADAAVFGIPDPEWGEQVRAVVEPRRPATAALAADIQAFLHERLAKFKCPKAIDFVDALPRDPNGKLARRKLRDPFWAETGRAI